MISHKSRESRYGQTSPLYCHAILRWLVPLVPSLVKQAGEDWQFIFFMMLESWRCLVLQLPRVCDAIAMMLAEIAARLSAVLGTRSGQPGGRGSALTNLRRGTCQDTMQKPSCIQEHLEMTGPSLSLRKQGRRAPVATLSSLSLSLGGVKNQLSWYSSHLSSQCPVSTPPLLPGLGEQQAGLLSQAAPSCAAFGFSGKCRDLLFKFCFPLECELAL